MNDERANDEGTERGEHSKEREILRILRKVLASIVRDTTPLPGMLHPLKQSTREDIRDLFGMIAEREAELARMEGISANERPYFADQPRTSSTVRLHPPAKGGEDDEG